MSKEKSEDLGIKLGSDDMVFWQRVIDAHKIDIENYKKALKLSEKVLAMAEEEYKKAEEEFKCTSHSSPTE